MKMLERDLDPSPILRLDRAHAYENVAVLYFNTWLLKATMTQNRPS